MLNLLALVCLQSSAELEIDPLLIVQAQEIWSVIGRKDNPVWLGWDARATPILIYRPGKQDVLINHPKPPEGFRPYTGPVATSIGKIHLKNGPTIFEFDGQNTATEVNGVPTLVVADTLSNRKQWIENLIGARADAKAIEDGILTNPYASMAMFAHEAFHVFQKAAAPGKGGNELALVKYPSLSVENNAGFALEADFLAAALRAPTPEAVRAAAVQWLAVRDWRRAALEKECADYEDGTEFNEGVAKYIEYRLYECLEKRKPAPQMWLVQGFRGYGTMAAEREGLIRQMTGFMSGANVVNNDPYGASPVRFRLYYSGMAAAALLDRLGATWKTAICRPETSLSSLARSAIAPTAEETQNAWRAIEASPRFIQLLNEKKKLAQDGERHIAEVLAGFDTSLGELVIDYSRLEKPRVGFAFTPFGILRIDASRTVFRLLPIRGVAGSLRFSEDGARPVMQDSLNKRIHMQLTKPSQEEEVHRQLGRTDGKATQAKLALPGVTLESLTGEVRIEGRRITVVLSP